MGYSSSPEIHAIFMEWYTRVFPITGGATPLQSQPPTTCLGMQFTYTDDTTSISMGPYINKVLTEYGLADCNPPTLPMTPGFALTRADRPVTDADRQTVVEDVNKLFPHTTAYSYKDVCSTYKSVLMSIAWYATMAGPTLELPVSILGRGMQYPSIKGFKALKQLLRFMKTGINTPMVYRKTRDWRKNEWPQLTFGSDASFNDDPDTSKSQGGYVGRFNNQAASTFISKQSATVVTSTYQAETHFASEAAKEIMYQRTLLNELGITQTAPTPLYVDNAAAVLDISSELRKFSKKNKHFTLQERYVHQCVADDQIAVIKIDGNNFDADAMTKALPKQPFAGYYTSLHNGTA